MTPATNNEPNSILDPWTWDLNDTQWDNPQPKVWDGEDGALEQDPGPRDPPSLPDPPRGLEIALVMKLESLQRMILALGDTIQAIDDGVTKIQVIVGNLQTQALAPPSPEEYIVQDSHVWLDSEDLNVRAKAGWTLRSVIEDTGNPVRYIWSRRTTGK